MWRVVTSLLYAVGVLSLSSCDGYVYEGMDGDEALSAANDMELPEVYEFYIDTYTGTSPPMLDVAKAFRRFGNDGTAYVTDRALSTSDPEEFEADMTALLILEHQCSQELEQRVKRKAKALGVNLALASDGCGSSTGQGKEFRKIRKITEITVTEFGVHPFGITVGLR